MQETIYTLYAEVCKALAHPARIKILDLLRAGERCVCELAPLVGISDSNLSQHLAILRKSGLVETRREGHSIFYGVRDRRIFQVIELLKEILGDQLAQTQAALGSAKP
jgi:DNA-binding transcriptional ArsR family regulator